jgi:competence protein ComEC
MALPRLRVVIRRLKTWARASRVRVGRRFRRKVERVRWEHAGGRHVRDAPVRCSLPVAFYIACLLWVGIVAGTYVYDAVNGVSTAVPDGLRSGRCVLVAVEDAKESGYGSYATMQMVGADGRLYKVQAVMGDADRILARQKVNAYAVVSALPEAQSARYRHQGIVARVRLTGIEPVEDEGPVGRLLDIRRWAMGQFDGFDTRGAALMRAVLLGDRSQLEQDGLYDDMKAAGLAHMVAVSGAHLAIVGALIMALLTWVGVGKRATFIVLIVFFVAYALLTGLAAPVVRAALMSGMAMGAVWGRRRGSACAALCVCVCVLLALDPSIAFSLSFFLSAASTMGIIVFSPLFVQWFDAGFGGRAPKTSDAFGLTTASNLAIFPVSVSTFSRIAVVSPIANLFGAPILTFLLAAGFGSLLLCAVLPPVGHVVLGAVVGAADLAAAGASALAHLPYASVFCSLPIPFAIAVTVAVVVALWVFWPVLEPRRARELAGVVAAVLVVAVLVAGHIVPDRIVMLDVGQGDAILIQSEGASMLVDTGNQDSALAAALGRQGVSRLDAVMVTHHDDDHCASLATLQTVLADDGKVLLHEDAIECSCTSCRDLVTLAGRVAGQEDVETVGYGDVIRVGRFSCRVVWPRAYSDQGGNADSICLLVSYDGDADGQVDFTTLMCGDAEADEISQIVAEGDVADIDVIKEGHHGSRAGMTAQLVAELDPEVALISVGADNSYGHPAPETLDNLQRQGARVFRTDEEGDVSCTFSAEKVEVTTMR